MTALKRLLDGFAGFREDFWPDNQPLFDRLVNQGQQPKVLLVACSDSRVDPGILTRTTPGDLFIVRNVAAIVPPYSPDRNYHGTSAALEFGVRGLKVEHIVVLGHALCGGIRALLNEGDAEIAAYEFLGPWTDIVRRAADAVRLGVPPNASFDEQRAVEQAAVIVSLGNVMSFPWVREGVAAGTLSVHGWYFDLRTGELYAFDPEQARFEPTRTRPEADWLSIGHRADDFRAENDRLLGRYVEGLRLTIAGPPLVD